MSIKIENEQKISRTDYESYLQYIGSYHPKTENLQIGKWMEVSHTQEAEQ